ncbi:MAG: hypothetical protein AAGF74_09825 [Pseudomonadota bacterium]
MKRRSLGLFAGLAGAVCVAGCGGITSNTLVAEEPAGRHAMRASVTPGLSTEGDVLLRWGRPVAKNRQGGQTEWIYQNTDRSGSPFVIVTFQYGIATRVQTIDEPSEFCRAQLPSGNWNSLWHQSVPSGDPTVLHRPCPGAPVSGGGKSPPSQPMGPLPVVPEPCKPFDIGRKGADCVDRFGEEPDVPMEKNKFLHGTAV